MSAVRGKDTQPEHAVRRFLHAAGFRFRLQVRTLPGRPDLWLPRHRAAIFVHGCFWHGHTCAKGKLPVTRRAFWQAKIAGNAARDAAACAALNAAGIRVFVVWQCELSEALLCHLAEALSPERMRVSKPARTRPASSEKRSR